MTGCPCPIHFHHGKGKIEGYFCAKVSAISIVCWRKALYASESGWKGRCAIASLMGRHSTKNSFAFAERYGLPYETVADYFDRSQIYDYLDKHSGLLITKMYPYVAELVAEEYGVPDS